MSRYALLVAAVVLACIAVQTHARVLRVEKILTAVIDDQDIDIEALLQNALSDEDGEDLELDVGEAVGGCSRGSCSYCKTINFIFTRKRFCLKARVLVQNMGFDLTIKMGSKTLYHKEISVANPPPVCIGPPGPLRKLGSLCIKLDNVNIAKKSACVSIGFKVKIGWVTKRFTRRIACFDIKGEGEGEGEADDTQAMQIESENSVETDDDLRYTGF